MLPPRCKKVDSTILIEMKAFAFNRSSFLFFRLGHGTGHFGRSQTIFALVFELGLVIARSGNCRTIRAAKSAPNAT